MKRALIVFFCFMLTLSFVACGSKDEGSSSPRNYTEITGETVECKTFSALLPDGWSNSPCYDIWADDGSTDPEKLMFVKADLNVNPKAAFSNPSVTIIHHSDNTGFMDISAMYEDITDVSFELAGVRWTGYTGKYLSYTNGILRVQDSTEWEVSTNFTSEKGDLSFFDPEIQAIIASLKVK